MTGPGRIPTPLAHRSPDEALWRALARRAVRGVPVALYEEGRLLEGRSGCPEATLNVREPQTYREVFRRGSVGLGQTYSAGWWEAEDLVTLIRLFARAFGASASGWARLTSPWSAVRPGRGARRRETWVPARSKDLDRADVRAHYDLGDDFFALFLDPTMTYSCAYFEQPGMTLEEASVAKLERICRLAELDAGDEVVEIGTGWGSFALHAAARYDCRITTTTVSSRQVEYARRRVDEAGLGHLVSVVDLDYRDLRGLYDKLVSIEMVEAVGWRQLDRFFRSCAGLLRPGGLMALQAIVIDDRFYERAKRRDDFIKAAVFPGSSIPSVGSLVSAARRTGALRLVECRDIGLHYAETLARWRRRFGEQRGALSRLGFDEDFFRLWDFYLAYCQAGFAERRISDVQLLFECPGASRHRGKPVL